MKPQKILGNVGKAVGKAVTPTNYIHWLGEGKYIAQDIYFNDVYVNSWQRNLERKQRVVNNRRQAIGCQMQIKQLEAEEKALVAELNSTLAGQVVLARQQFMEQHTPIQTSAQLF